MAVRRIIRMGHPVLRQVASEIDLSKLGTPWFSGLLEDMVDTLRDYGGIGLAAPQIAEPWRLALIEIAGGPTRYGDIPNVPLTAFINPTIEVLNASTEGFWEGCLSVPGLRGFVERPQHVRVRYTTIEGDSEELELHGFIATVFQHEFDHLDGRLYVDRINDSTMFAFEEEYLRYLEPQELAGSE